MEPQEPAKVMMVSSCIPPPPPEPKPLQITSTTFKAEGVRLAPQQLHELKAFSMEQDEQRTKLISEEDWCGLLDHAQHLFWALSIPFRLAHLLHHLLAMCHTPDSSETLLMKVLAVGQKKSLEATCQHIHDYGMELPPPPPPCK